MRTLIEKAWRQITGDHDEIGEYVELSGGSINHAARIWVNDKLVFVKWNDHSLYPAMFEKEADGLALLASCNVARIPEVIGVTHVDKQAFLFLEFIQAGKPTSLSFEMMGQQLALIHQHKQERYGLHGNNFIGSLQQSNEPKNDWVEFFIWNRLQPLIDLAFQTYLLTDEHVTLFNRLFGKLESLIPNEPPSLLHGDLWSGNVFVDHSGQPVFIDPAVYYGNREMDLAMTKLFGGFPPNFYKAYNESFPLQHGWMERTEIHNLYPLLVHLNLFGKGYLPDILQTLRRFTG